MKPGWNVGKKYWKASHGSWYCWVKRPDGRRVDRRLDPDCEQAEQVRQDIRKEVEMHGTPALEGSLDALIQQFLAYTKANRSAGTFVNYRNYLSSFLHYIGRSLTVRQLRVHHVEGWLTKCYPASGNPNTRNGAISVLKRVLNWARAMQFFDYDPLRSLPTGAAAPHNLSVQSNGTRCRGILPAARSTISSG